MAFSPWLEQTIAQINRIGERGNDYVRGRASRMLGKALCVPVCCSPCLAWSTVWRVVCCPVSCIRGFGPLSNNECTNMTDMCVAKTWQEFDVKIKALPIADYQVMVDALRHAASVIQHSDTRLKYEIADYMTLVYRAVLTVDLTERRKHVDGMKGLEIDIKLRTLDRTDVLPFYIEDYFNSVQRA